MISAVMNRSSYQTVSAYLQTLRESHCSLLPAERQVKVASARTVAHAEGAAYLCHTKALHCCADIFTQVAAINGGERWW